MPPSVLSPPSAPITPTRRAETALRANAAPSAAGAAELFAEQPARITARGLLSMATFYLAFGVFYGCTIAYNDKGLPVTELRRYLDNILLYDYPLKALWTLPVWWLLFRTRLDRAGWLTLLLAHAVLAPLWIWGWFTSYYAMLSYFKEWGLTGAARKWDVYIPALFYGVQFGVLHMVRYTEQLQHRTRQAQALQARAHSSEMAALKAQINPHFLFNTLNSISASVPPELEETRTLVVRLAHTFRFALDASRHEQLPLAEELDFLRNYLALEQARFGERLQVIFDVDESLLPVALPPMLLQPLVENAVRHGLAPLVEGGTLTVQARRESARSARFTVTDTGLGLSPGTSSADWLTGQGVGLGNTHARLRALGSPGLELRPHTPRGLEVSFALPLELPHL